ncbi:MAG: hypothetical protein KAT29_05960, partial [Anaerolineales bacterium]|nr:hypothetical protein [Anaerolineales bacterium]
GKPIAIAGRLNDPRMFPDVARQLQQHASPAKYANDYNAPYPKTFFCGKISTVKPRLSVACFPL